MTVKLLKDVVLDGTDNNGIKISNGGIITLDLNGCTLSRQELTTIRRYSATIVLNASSDLSSKKKTRLS